MSEPEFLMDGFLWKKRSDAKKSLMTGKYQKRFFKLTTADLAYASCAKDFKGAGGKIELYPLNELMWVRKREKVKISLKFPERMLRVKSDSENEATKWFNMLEQAREQYAEEIEEKYFGPSSPQNDEGPELDYEPDDTPLEFPGPITQPQKKKYSDVRTIEVDSDSSDEEEMARARRVKMATKSVSGPSGLPPMSDLDVVASNARSPSVSANRPPSPRSMLANARTGSQLVTMPKEEDCITLDKPRMVAHSSGSGTGIGSQKVQQEDEALVLDNHHGAAAAASGMGRLNIASKPAEDEHLVLGGVSARAPAVKAHPGRIELGGPAGRPGFTSNNQATEENWLEEDFDSSDDEDDVAAIESPAPMAPSSKPKVSTGQSGGNKSQARPPAESPVSSPVATGGVADANFAEDDWDDDDD